MEPSKDGLTDRKFDLTTIERIIRPRGRPINGKQPWGGSISASICAVVSPPDRSNLQSVISRAEPVTGAH